jgi:hypothetical protein
MVEVRAAIDMSRKKSADHSCGIGISAKINGRVSKISVGPCVGSNPSTLNTAGNITIPESMATISVIPPTDTAVEVRFVPFLKYDE